MTNLPLFLLSNRENLPFFGQLVLLFPPPYQNRDQQIIPRTLLLQKIKNSQKAQL